MSLQLAHANVYDIIVHNTALFVKALTPKKRLSVRDAARIKGNSPARNFIRPGSRPI